MVSAADITPSLERVGQEILRRTKDGRGKTTGTFSAGTTPTDEGAQVHIDAAARQIAMALRAVGPLWPDDLDDEAQDAVASEAALRIERGAPNPDAVILAQLDKQALNTFRALKANVQAAQHSEGRMGSITMVSPYSGDPDPLDDLLD